MNEGETCETCAYFNENAGVPNGGFCRRYPPTIVFIPTPAGPKGGGSSPTLTTRNGWCGEWKKGSVIRLANKIHPVEPGRN